jgi:hypothetical protein
MAETGGRYEGKGGTVLLIAGTLFLGYLYFTRRLQAVITAIQTPGSMSGTIANQGITAQGVTPTNPYATPYATVPVSPGGYPRNFTIHFQPPYQNVPPIEVSADSPQLCYSLTYSGVLQATGSQALAAIYAARYCA